MNEHSHGAATLNNPAQTATCTMPPASDSPLLMAAYQCGPGMGSVSQIGWEWFIRTAQRRPVTLVTHTRNRSAIEAQGPLPAQAEVIYIDTEWFAGPLYRLARKVFPHSEHGVFLVASLDYFVFDALALRVLRRLQPMRPWSALHIVTPVTLAAPSRLHKLGLPVVWGPLNCGLHSPAGFETLLRHERPWLIRLRELPRLLDGLMGSTRHTRVLLTATRATRAAVPARHRERCHDMLENGVDLSRFVATPWPPAPDTTQPLNVLFVGRMIALKGVTLLLRAVAQLTQQGHAIALTLVGDGPEKAQWMAEAQVLGIGAHTRFTGALPLQAVAGEMQACHVFCLPSVRESGGAVLLEAMASGRPVVAIAHGGPAELVDEHVGCAIAPTDPDDVVTQLVHALADVASHPTTWAAKGQMGRQRVLAHHDWEQKISAAQGIYAAVSA